MAWRRNEATCRAGKPESRDAGLVENVLIYGRSEIIVESSVGSSPATGLRRAICPEQHPGPAGHAQRARRLWKPVPASPYS